MQVRVCYMRGISMLGGARGGKVFPTRSRVTQQPLLTPTQVPRGEVSPQLAALLLPASGVENLSATVPLRAVHSKWG